MAEETNHPIDIWKMVAAGVPALLLIWGWLTYRSTAKGSMTVLHYRTAENAVWVVMAGALVYFTYKLVAVYRGGILEKGLAAFMVSFLVILIWKFVTVMIQFNQVDSHQFEHTIEFLEGISGIVVGLAFLYMYTLLRSE